MDALLAPSEDWRCRCKSTSVRCRRKATGEDLLCDWCRATDHMAFCESVLQSYRVTGSPYAADSFEVGYRAYEPRPLDRYRLAPLVNSPPSVVVVTGLR